MILLAFAISSAVGAQTPATQSWSAPPLVVSPTTPTTPPVPSAVGAGPVGAPALPYPYSPYQHLEGEQESGPEVGLMISESLFGMLTSAGVSLLPYFWLLRPVVQGRDNLFGSTPDSALGPVIFALFFAGAVPLSVAQTQVALANGSRRYVSETWPAALAALASEGAVLGLFFLTGGFAAGYPGRHGDEIVLLVGSAVITPLISMAVLNLAKAPRIPPRPANVAGGISWRPPSVGPIAVQTRLGTEIGVHLSLASAAF